MKGGREGSTEKGRNVQGDRDEASEPRNLAKQVIQKLGSARALRISSLGAAGVCARGDRDINETLPKTDENKEDTEVCTPNARASPSEKRRTVLARPRRTGRAGRIVEASVWRRRGGSSNEEVVESEAEEEEKKRMEELEEGEERGDEPVPWHTLARSPKLVILGLFDMKGLVGSIGDEAI
ncbi:hypothetical protein BJV78DRAFT_1355873 [Lactifluus subvellereus]|nr:hypothetical protein BJV78DRAFT_1355873 [Lactifluus subvellereus]